MTAVVHELDRVMAGAAALLGRRIGSTVQLDDPEDLGGSGRTTVLRARVIGTRYALPRTVVIKSLSSGGVWGGFTRELASYRYVTALARCSRPGPELLAADPRAGVLVLSDLGDGSSMTELLATERRERVVQSLSAWGQALGRMHAATVGGEQDFDALLRLGTGRPADPIAREAVAAPVTVKRIAESVFGPGTPAGSPPPEVSRLLKRAAGLLAGGDYRVFSPSDVGPENILINDEGVKFLDYEWGGFRDASLDIGYALVTYPGHLRRQRGAGAGSEPGSDQAITALDAALAEGWRAEVVGSWPSLEGDRHFRTKLLTVRLLWVWLSTTWVLPGRGLRADLQGLALYSSDARVVLDRWRGLARAARAVDYEPVAEWADAVADGLRDRRLS